MAVKVVVVEATWMFFSTTNSTHRLIGQFLLTEVLAAIGVSVVMVVTKVLYLSEDAGDEIETPTW